MRKEFDKQTYESKKKVIFLTLEFIRRLKNK